VVVTQFLSPAALAERVLDLTLLNVHPPLADAYGMTAVEAAARGAPSVLHHGDAVGAAALLAPGEGRAFAVDLAAPPAALAAAVAALLADRDRLDAVAAAAREAALAHDEGAHGRALEGALRGVVAAAGSA
jgi:glycosyltransferase involved in cell wall biosynthesis